MGTSFRIADPDRPDDVRAIAGLCEELGYPSAEAEVAPRVERIVAAPDEALIVAELDGRVAGWIQVQALATVVDEPFALIAGLVVTRDARGQGVGRGLVLAAESWARARGVPRMVVRSRDTRPGAHRFYAGLDYEVRKTQLVFGKRLG